MKKISLILALFLFGINNVYAECNNDDIKKLKSQVENVEISYIVREPEEGEYGMVYGIVDVLIQNMPDNFSIYSEYDNAMYYADDFEDGIIYIYGHLYGKYSFDIYSDECYGKPIRKIDFVVPRYNPYSEDELCNDIPDGALDVCNDFYNYEIDYDTFAKKVNDYRNKVKKTDPKEENVITKFFNDSFDFIKENVIYIISSIIVVAIIVIFVVINKKRGELK